MFDICVGFLRPNTTSSVLNNATKQLSTVYANRAVSPRVLLEGDTVQEILHQFKNTKCAYLVLMEHGTIITNQRLVYECIHEMGNMGSLVMGLMVEHDGIVYPSPKFLIIDELLLNKRSASTLWPEAIDDEEKLEFFQESCVPAIEMFGEVHVKRGGYGIIRYASRAGWPVLNLTEEQRGWLHHIQPRHSSELMDEFIHYGPSMHPNLFPEQNLFLKWSSGRFNSWSRDIDVYGLEAFEFRNVSCAKAFSDQSSFWMPSEREFSPIIPYDRTMMENMMFTSHNMTDDTKCFSTSTFKATIGHLYAPAGGFSALKILRNNHFSENTNVYHYSVSGREVWFRQHLVREWDGVDLPAFINDFRRRHDVTFNHLEHYQNDMWLHVIAEFGGEREFKTLWQAFKKLKHNYVTMGAHTNTGLDEIITQTHDVYLYMGDIHSHLVMAMADGRGAVAKCFESLIANLKTRCPRIVIEGYDPDGRYYTYRA